MTRQGRLILTFFLLAACGGSAPAPKQEGAQPNDSGAKQPNADAQRAPAGKSIAEHREDFMSRCTSQIPAPDYCQCSWDVMAKMYTEAEMNETNVDQAKMQAYKQQVTSTCAGKLPESTVKDRFVKGCVGERDKLSPYCDCAWTELRKQLSAGDLAVDGIETTPRFASAKKAMVKKCGPKMPEEIPHDDFLNGCMKDDPQKKPFCQCAWKTARAQMSPAEIAAADASDMEPLKDKVNKSCGKLLQAK